MEDFKDRCDLLFDAINECADSHSTVMACLEEFAHEIHNAAIEKASKLFCSPGLVEQVLALKTVAERAVVSE